MNVSSPGAEDTASHVASLPVEILTLIFEDYLDVHPPAQGEFYGYTTTLTRRSPIVLTRVCGRWRAIALGTPSLWTFICPSYESIPNVRRWLAICPKYPLDLRLPHRAINAVPGDYVRSLFNLFSKETYRWRSLSIGLDPEVTNNLVHILRSDNSIPSLLENLKVEPSIQRDFQVPGPTLGELVTLLPRLKALRRFIWIEKRGATLLHGVPWSQLKTVLIMLSSSLEDIFSYLSQCASAITVEIQDVTRDRHRKTRLPQERFPHFILPNLTSLKLSRGCDPMWLLRHFTIPSLQCLEVGILHRDLSTLQDFLTRSPSIHTLIIDERDYGDYEASNNGSELSISDCEIVAYLTNPCLRAIPRVGLDLMYTKKRIIALIQEYRESDRPLPPLLCWIPEDWNQRLVGWCDELGTFDRLLFSYENGSLELAPRYQSDADFRF